MMLALLIFALLSACQAPAPLERQPSKSDSNGSSLMGAVAGKLKNSGTWMWNTIKSAYKKTVNALWGEDGCFKDIIYRTGVEHTDKSKNEEHHRHLCCKDLCENHREEVTSIAKSHGVDLSTIGTASKGNEHTCNEDCQKFCVALGKYLREYAKDKGQDCMWYLEDMTGKDEPDACDIGCAIYVRIVCCCCFIGNCKEGGCGGSESSGRGGNTCPLCPFSNPW